MIIYINNISMIFCIINDNFPLVSVCNPPFGLIINLTLFTMVPVVYYFIAKGTVCVTI